MKTTIEAIVRETSDKIWNQNGKHTHAELDEIIRTALTTQQEEVVKEMHNVIERMAQQAIKYPAITTLTYKESPMYNRGYLDALADLKQSRFLTPPQN